MTDDTERSAQDRLATPETVCPDCGRYKSPAARRCMKCAGRARRTAQPPRHHWPRCEWPKEYCHCLYLSSGAIAPPPMTHDSIDQTYRIKYLHTLVDIASRQERLDPSLLDRIERWLLEGDGASAPEAEPDLQAHEHLWETKFLQVCSRCGTSREPVNESPDNCTKSMLCHDDRPTAGDA